MEKDEGRPMSVYGSWRPRAFEHDVLGVTEFALAYRDFEWIRGNELDRNADGIMFIDEEKLYVEVERKMPSGRIRDKLKKNYKDCDGLLLVVAMTEEKRKAIVEACQEIRSVIGDVSLFGVLSDCRSDPHGDVWIDLDGAPKALNKPCL